MNNVKSLKEIVKQLRSCGFTCEAGPLENNVDFQMLERIAGVEPAMAITKSDTVWVSAKPTFTPISPQELRDEIIEQAKRDVAEKLKNKPSVNVSHMLGYGRITLDNYSIEFIVNNEKRTVVAILRGNVSQSVRAKGIAKCTPSDCFNSHIGKAIALRRALGLEVPTEYLNAPQPTEVRVGDVVEYRSIISGLTALTISELIENPMPSSYPGQAFRAQGVTGWLTDSQVTIIDDTRDGTNE